MKLRNRLINWIIGLCVIFPLSATANVLLEWETIELGNGVTSLESSWEITDAAASGVFGFTSVDVVDFYLRIETVDGVYLFEDENMTQIGGPATPFQIDPDQQLHTPSDVGFVTTDGHTLSWYSDPLDPIDPSPYASFLRFEFSYDGEYVLRSAIGQWNLAVPEPSVLVLMMAGLFGLAAVKRVR